MSHAQYVEKSESLMSVISSPAPKVVPYIVIIWLCFVHFIIIYLIMPDCRKANGRFYLPSW